jgi:hypothetical protein
MPDMTYTGLAEAAAAIQSPPATAFDPEREVEAWLQGVIQHIRYGVDGARPASRDYAVGVRTRVERLMAQPKEEELTNLQLFLERTDEALDFYQDDPETMARFREIIDKTEDWGERNPGKLPPSTRVVNGPS